MVKKLESVLHNRAKHKKNVKVDVIILGCTLPGIVTAHKLKNQFGSSMDIMVLDLIGTTKRGSKLNVAFQENDNDESSQELTDATSVLDTYDKTAKQVIDNVARYYLAKYAKEFKIPLPDAIIAPEQFKSQLNKVFQHSNGKTVDCATDYHDFEYLNFMEKFELNQYQTLLDQSMKMLFHTDPNASKNEGNSLLYYDKTTMEKHICDALFFDTSREIMRTTVRLVCGAPAKSVSVLFYLHQCYRTSGTRKHLDGNNTRFREKLLGYCGQRLAHKLQQSIADITQAVKNITEIRTCPENHVVVETVKGEATYVCSLLAMALKPHQLNKIQVEDVLMSKNKATITRDMVPGLAKKFIIQYEENFWSRLGYSGDILSIRGPIIWAMERPKLSTTGSKERYSALIGYLIVKDGDHNSREAVIAQLGKLFGERAASPVSYKESGINDVFVPRCGDYVALRKMVSYDSPKFLEWASLDIFAEGDVAAALEAGHIAYIHLLSCLRPQAQSYEDLSAAERPTFLSESPLPRWMSHINWVNGVRWSVMLSVTLLAYTAFKSYMRR